MEKKSCNVRMQVNPEWHEFKLKIYYLWYNIYKFIFRR